MQSPGGEIRSGLFHLKFSNRTAAARHDVSSPNARRLRRRQRARRPNLFRPPLAGTRERAGVRVGEIAIRVGGIYVDGVARSMAIDPGRTP